MELIGAVAAADAWDAETRRPLATLGGEQLGTASDGQHSHRVCHKPMQRPRLS